MLRAEFQIELNGQDGPFKLEFELDLPKGHTLAITGPSGAGKTTVLQILAGLQKADQAKIQFGQEIWVDTEKRHWLPPAKRQIGYVFQEYGLFPHMSIRRNLEYALPAHSSKSSIEFLLDMSGLAELSLKFPKELSGGQQQRVALVRSLLTNPRLLLMDEPLSAQDAALRKDLQDSLKAYLNALEIPTILVSHDKDEILKWADEVIILERGKIINRGNPDILLLGQPRSFLAGEIIAHQHSYSLLKIDHQILQIPPCSFSIGSRVRYFPETGFLELI